MDILNVKPYICDYPVTVLWTVLYNS
jgi:hypothetical protein